MQANRPDGHDTEKGGPFAALLGALLLAACVLAPAAQAAGRKAGSLLLFPVFDAHPSKMTVLTVTNTNGDTTLDPVTGLESGTVDVVFKYVDGGDCSPEDRVERLSPNDTLSVIVSQHDPETDETGFCYVYAVDVQTGLPIAFDYLIGTATIFDSLGQVSFDIPPLAFKAGTKGPDDHKLALDGLEYEPMPDKILFPRFFGQGQGGQFLSPFASRVVFLNLTGGAKFTAVADVLVYNDNEQVFSSTVTFDCWEAMDLLEVSGATQLSFLENTNQDPGEVYIGSTPMEVGWIRIDGEIAYNLNVVFDDPAVYAVLLDKLVVGGYSAVTLPFEEGAQDNGLLWSMSPQGGL